MIDIGIGHLIKRFGRTEVVRDISLEIPKGELCCLLGPSGCGKTTTLRIVAGLLEADGGTIHLAGKDISNMPAQKRNLGMVFQNYALFPHMNVSDNIAYGLRRRRVSGEQIKERVAKALRMVRLEGYAKRRIHELSGGQQQRVALARALVIEPAALLLDEPLSNLDARLRTDMREEIRRIQKELGITTIYVTHDQEEAMSIADRIVLMNQGVIEQVGEPRQIYERPASRFVADFIGRVNLLSGKVAGREVEILGRRFAMNGRHFNEGDELACALRPECIRFTEPGDALFEASVAEMTYLGPTVRYRLQLEADQNGDHKIAVEVPGPQAVYEVGQQIGVTWGDSDLHFFPEKEIE